MAGFDLQRDEMTRTSSNLAHWHDKDSVTSVQSELGGKDENYAVFVQDAYQWSEKVKVYGGLRLDHYKKYSGYFNDYVKNKSISYDEATYNEWSPKISLEYNMADDTSCYVSYGHSFNPPTLYKLYRTDTNYETGYVGNPDLKPEKSNTFEVGFKKNWADKMALKAAAYLTKTTDLINVSTVAGTSHKQYVNIDKADRRGLELDFRKKFNNNWNSYLNYSWELAYDDDDNRICEIPKHIIHAGVLYNKGKFGANLDTEYVSNRNKPGETSGVYLSQDAVVLLNTGFNYKFNPKASAFFTINNLFDRAYSATWALAAGRTYNLGFEFTF